MMVCHCGKPAKAKQSDMLRIRMGRNWFTRRTWYFCSAECMRWWMREEQSKW